VRLLLKAAKVQTIRNAPRNATKLQPIAWFAKDDHKGDAKRSFSLQAISWSVVWDIVPNESTDRTMVRRWQEVGIEKDLRLEYFSFDKSMVILDDQEYLGTITCSLVS